MNKIMTMLKGNKKLVAAVLALLAVVATYTTTDLDDKVIKFVTEKTNSVE